MRPDPRLASLPALRALAEQEARDAYSSMRDVGIMYPYDEHGRKRSEPDPWAQLPSGTRDWWVAARLTLLADLSRPESRDAVARLVAEQLGLECGPTAPTLSVLRRGGRPTWRLTQTASGGWHHWFSELSFSECSPLLDPPAALLTIALHVLTETP